MTTDAVVARTLHILEVRTRGLAVEARLNDIPVFTEPVGRGRLFQLKCEPYLVTGENELRVRLRLPGGSLVDEESRDLEEAKAPYCRARVVRLHPEAIAAADAPSTEAAPPREMAAWAWDPEQHPLQPGRAFEAGPWFFAAESPGGRWSWEQATPYQPAGEDPAEIRVLVEKLWKAVSFLDVDAVVHLTREKTRELAVALGVNAGELELDQASYLSSLFTSPGWGIAPLEQEAIVLEPAARGRLVEVRTVDGEAPIRGSDGKRSFIIRPMVAKIEGGWRVVR